MKQPDLLLIHPAGHKKIYQNLSGALSALEPPVWALMTAAFVLREGFTADILDAEALGLNAEETARKALEIPPRFIGIAVYGHNPSASTQMMPAVRETCAALKKMSPDTKIILFGGHSSALPERTLSEEPCDFVSGGEGPLTVLHLLKNTPLTEVPDLWFRENGETKLAAVSAPLIQNLDENFPELPWHLLPMEKYRAHNWHCFGGLSRQPYASIYTTLGCPYRCEFCCIQAPFKKGEKVSGMKPEVSSYRFWSPQWVIRQIDALVLKYGVRNIKFADEMFVLNNRHVHEICDLLIERGYGLNIWAYARVDTAKDPALLAKLKKAGFNWLVLGIEAADMKTRQDVDKNFKQEDIFDSVREIQKAGIYVLANFIFGLPEDTRQTMEETFQLALDLNAEFANFYCAMAYPGSALYSRALLEKWTLPDSWGGYSQHSADSRPLPTRSLNAAEVLQFRDRAFNMYFNRPDYFDMIRRKFNGSAAEEIQQMTSVRLKRTLEAGQVS